MSPPPSEESTTSDDRLYFRQLLSGRDFGTADRVAQQMVNFVYLIGDRHTGEAVIVDPAYDVPPCCRFSRPTACGVPGCSPPTTTRTTLAAR